MNFLYGNYLPAIAIAFVIFAILVFVMERRFFNLVEKYWFYRRSLLSWLSTLLFLGGMGALLLSLLDARGPEEKIKTPVPKSRTIILVDTSASMLAEDVKPSRLQKAALIAKHFARKAAGHQISLVAFSEITKKVVPFTTDLDLIDARLDSIKNLRNQYASSAVTVAIQESIQYFRETGEDAGGNILVLTDGEETAPAIRLKIPEDIHVALVGIGTSNGGRIPLDDGRGFRFGYKKDAGLDVITKLNEGFFRKVAEDLPSGKYWIANTYTLPSDEIVDFFKSEFDKGMNEQDMVVRPVMMEWLVIPGVLALALSYFLKAIRVFALLLLFFLPLAQAEEISPELESKLQELSEGKLNRLERLKLADELYQAGSKPEALKLFEENLSPKEVDKDVPPEAYLNYGTALLDSNEEQKGLQVYERLSQSVTGNDSRSAKVKEIMEKNVVTHFQVKKQKQQQKKEKQNKQDQNNPQQGQSGENKDQSSSGQDQKNQQQGQGQQKDQQRDPKDQQGEGKQGEDKKEEGKDKKDEKGKEGEEKNKENEGKDGDEQKDKEGQPKESPGERQLQARRKVDPKLRQLMDDDRQLQIKMMENATRDLNKRKDRKSKDW